MERTTLQRPYNISWTSLKPIITLILISMFHHAFLNLIIDKHQHNALHIQQYISLRMLISMLKYIKIHKGTLTGFNLNRSSSGSRSVPH